MHILQHKYQTLKEEKHVVRGLTLLPGLIVLRQSCFSLQGSWDYKSVFPIPDFVSVVPTSFHQYAFKIKL